MKNLAQIFTLLSVMVVFGLNSVFSQSIGQSERPQTPHPPFPYRSIEVRYENQTVPEVTLAGTLTVPEGEGPFPAVLLIGGSGQFPRDQPFYGHKWMLVLADYLSRRGIATLRFDDRGAGESTSGPKPLSKLTGEDLISDTRAGLTFLSTRHEIDSKRIGLIGHSQGAGMAQVLAVESVKPEIAFTVLMAGGGTSTSGEIVAEQSATIGRISGFSAKAQKADKDFVRRSLIVMRDETDAVKRLAAISAIADESLVKVPENERKKVEPGIRTRVRILSSEAFHQNSRKPQKDYLRMVRCPVLALIGEKDVLVSSKVHIPKIKGALKVGGNKDYLVKELPHLNHMFQTAGTGLMEEAKDIKETIAPAALRLIGDWIVRHTKK